MLPKHLIQDNFWYLLAWYQFVDGQYILPTFFEWSIFLQHFWVNSHIQATKNILEEYIKHVIDPELSQA
jgi:hypothetical protein